MGTDLEDFFDRCDDMLDDWSGSDDAMRYRAGRDQAGLIHPHDRPARGGEPDESWRVWFDWTC